MGPSPGTSAARVYAGTMADFWSGLQATLRRLETIAADSRRLDGDMVEQLRALQYRLHWSSELLAGVHPPPGTRDGHEELARALVYARDATGEMAEAIEEDGGDGAAELLLEWRGALFGVRLARMRLTVKAAPVADVPVAPPYAAAAATALTILGAFAFAAGALFVLWPVWAGGLALVAGGLIANRP